MKKMHSVCKIGDFAMPKSDFRFWPRKVPKNFFFLGVSKLPTVHIRSTLSSTGFT